MHGRNFCCKTTSVYNNIMCRQNILRSRSSSPFFSQYARIYAAHNTRNIYIGKCDAARCDTAEGCGKTFCFISPLAFSSYSTPRVAGTAPSLTPSVERGIKNVRARVTLSRRLVRI